MVKQAGMSVTSPAILSTLQRCEAVDQLKQVRKTKIYVGTHLVLDLLVGVSLASYISVVEAYTPRPGGSVYPVEASRSRAQCFSLDFSRDLSWQHGSMGLPPKGPVHNRFERPLPFRKS